MICKMWCIDMQRGVCFEVTYYGFFADIKKRTHIISSAKVIFGPLSY